MDQSEQGKKAAKGAGRARRIPPGAEDRQRQELLRKNHGSSARSSRAPANEYPRRLLQNPNNPEDPRKKKAQEDLEQRLLQQQQKKKHGSLRSGPGGHPSPGRVLYGRDAGIWLSQAAGAGSADTAARHGPSAATGSGRQARAIRRRGPGRARNTAEAHGQGGGTGAAGRPGRRGCEGWNGHKLSCGLVDQKKNDRMTQSGNLPTLHTHTPARLQRATTSQHPWRAIAASKGGPSPLPPSCDRRRQTKKEHPGSARGRPASRNKMWPGLRARQGSDRCDVRTGAVSGETWPKKVDEGENGS